MTFLLVFSFVASAGLMVLSWRDRGEGETDFHKAGAWLGQLGFIGTWAIFVPVNVWAKITHQTESWIFGSETFDGGIVETATIGFYGGAIVCAFLLFRRASAIYGSQAAPMWRIILMLGIMSFIVMIGEEISWGQHWLGFATPEGLAEVNLQHESNVHNLVSPRIYDAIYQVLGFSLILGPPVATYWLRSWSHLTIVRFLRDCFSWPVTYGLMVSAGILLQHEAFEELSEMVLAFAVFHALLSLSLRPKRA